MSRFSKTLWDTSKRAVLFKRSYKESWLPNFGYAFAPKSSWKRLVAFLFCFFILLALIYLLVSAVLLAILLSTPKQEVLTVVLR